MQRAMLLFFIFLLAPFNWAHAQTPEVNSFSVSPASGSSGFPYSFTWTLSEANGSLLLFPCVDGIKLKNADTGAAISCGSKTSFGGASSGGALVKISNVSGTSKTISAQLIPKDLSGKEYAAAAKTTSVIVATNPQPIEKFTSSATTTKPGVSVSITWNAPDTNGVNLSIECKEGIRVSSPSYTDSPIMPCGKLIFSKVLAASGSLTLTFINSVEGVVPYQLTLFPAITATTYNGIHTSSINIDVASDVVGDPEITSFTTIPSPPTVYSKDKLQISWETTDAKGVNLKISCDNSITAATSSLSPFLPCNQPIFANPLPEKGNLTLIFQNFAGVNKTVALNLIPAFKNKGGYNEFKSKGVSVTVRSAEAPTLSPTPSPAPPPPPPSPPTPKGVGLPAGQAGAPTPDALDRGVGAKTPATEKSQESLSELLQRLFPSKEPVSFTKESETAPPRDIKSTQEITIFKDAKLFNLFPIKLKVKIRVKADDGRVISTRFPWWSFLTKF